MTLILSGTNGLSDVDGSAATPAIRGTDTNTGIFFPAADTIAFAEGGAEVARFDSAGNLGLGTTSPTERLTVAGNIKLGTSGTTYIYGPSTTGRSFLSNSDSTAYIGIYGSSYGSGSNSILSFVTGTSNVMTMDASGNLGLGVTPSAWLSDYKVQQLGSTSSVYGRVATNETGVNQNWYRDASAVFRYIGNGYAAAYIQLSGGGHGWFTSANNVSGAGASLTLTQAMTLDVSGFLGIGTTSPAGRLHISGGTTNTARIDGSTGGGSWAVMRNGAITGGIYNTGAVLGDTTSGAAIFAETGYDIRFYTNGSATERMRLDTAGLLLVGVTSSGSYRGNTASGEFYRAVGSAINAVSGASTAAGQQVMGMWHRATSGTRIFIEFATDNPSTATVGSITTGGTSTAYNTSSDYRLKEDIQPMTGALARVAALKPVTYKWKADGSDGEGFIAHELQEVVPECVTGVKDGVDAEGNPKYQGIDTSFLVATLTAAIQELKAEFDAYKLTHP